MLILKGLKCQQEASQQPQSPDQQRAGMEQSGGVPAGANPDDDSGVGGDDRTGSVQPGNWLYWNRSETQE